MIKVIISKEKYNQIIEVIGNKLICNTNSRQSFYDELVFFTHNIDPVFPLSPAWQDRDSNRYVDELRRRLNLDPSSLLPEGLEMFILCDVFFFILQKVHQAEKRSILINLFWQEIYIARFIYAWDLKTDSEHLAFYFRYHNTIPQPEKLCRNNDFFFSPEAFLLVMQNCIAADQAGIPPRLAIPRESNICFADEYPHYVFNALFSPIPQEFFHFLKKTNKEGETDEKLALLYYFRRTHNDNFIKYYNIADDGLEEIEENYLEEWYLSFCLYENLKGDKRGHLLNLLDENFKKKHTYTLLKYQAILRCFVITHYQNYRPVLEELAVLLESQQRFIQKVQIGIRSPDFFRLYGEQLEKMLYLLNGCGGLNLFQLNSLQKMDQAGIRWPLGYITQDFRSRTNDCEGFFKVLQAPAVSRPGNGI